MKIKNFIVTTLALMAIITVNTVNAQDNWQVLFDGTDLSQWRNYQQNQVSDGWAIKNGELTLVKKGAGDIMTKQQYDNFELSLEWKISAAGNSGVFYHVVENDELPQVYYSGLEMQILDNHGRSEPPLEQAGALFALYSPVADFTKPVGEFNVARIIVDGDYIEHWLNGHKVVDYQRNSKDFNQQLHESKFATWPVFAKSSLGHIALQDHGDEVAFRNIKIRRITQNKSK